MPERDVSQGGGGSGGGGTPPPPPLPPPPHAELGYSVDYLTVHFTDRSTAGTGATLKSLQIAYGDGTSDTPAPGSTWTHTYPAAGGYRYLLIVTDSAGQTDQASSTITATIPPPGPPHASLAASEDGLTVTFTDTSTATPPAYIAETFIDYGNGHTFQPAPGAIWHYTYPAAGTYTGVLSVIDSNRQTDQGTFTLTLEAPPPPPPTADFDYTTDDLTATFTDKSRVDESATLDHLAFTFGDGSSAAVAPAGTVAHTYGNEGAYSVALAATDSRGHTSSVSKTVTLKKKGKPNTWAGWQTDILHAIKAPLTDDTLAFLDAFNQSVDRRGGYNPLAAKHDAKGATDVAGTKIKNYPTTAEAVTATKAQLDGKAYKAIKGGLVSGKPGATVASKGIDGELKAWGVNVPLFLQIYYQLTQTPVTLPGKPGEVPAGIADAWKGVLNYYDKTVPQQHDDVRKAAAALVSIFK